MLIAVVVVVGIVFAQRALTSPRYRTVVADPVDPSGDPVQIDIQSGDPIPISFKDGEAELVPKAKYRMAAKVCGRKKYSQPWQALVAPYDLCLSWGRLATEDMKGKVKFSQDMRWYQFRIQPDTSFDVDYVQKHSSNTHIIYADANLKKAVRRIGRGDEVEMTGYLVYIKGKYKGHDVWWNSSLRRDDGGDGACEVFYITSLRKGKRLYGTPTEVE